MNSCAPDSKNVHLERKTTIGAIYLNFVYVFSALPVYFSISNPVESHIYKYSLNNLHHHRSKWSGFTAKKTPSIVGFDEN